MDSKPNRRIVPAILSALCSLCFAALFLWLLLRIGVTVGAGNAETQEARAVLDYAEAYALHVNNLSAAAMEGILPIPKSYSLPEDTVVAPKPDPARFGASADAADTAAVLDRAAALLDGQTTIWTPETEIPAGSAVHWYQDDTILSITWKQVIARATFTFTEVKIAHPSQFRRYLADNTFASPVQYLPSELAATVNAVSAMSADFYKFRPVGTVVYRRQLCRADGGVLDTCFVDTSGDLLFVHRGTLKSAEEIQQYVDQHDVLFSLSFGPILIENGQNVMPDTYPIGEVDEYYARAAICQLGECHYLMVTVNGDKEFGPLHATTGHVADALMALGVPNAYTLDGGQTASMIVNGELINAVEFGYQRAVSDIIFFATAIPEPQKGDAAHG